VTGGDVLDINWTASDKNLGADSVHLYYAVQRNGPWLPIAKGLKNAGQFSWNFPRDAGSQFYIRLEVVDEAGNMTRSDLTSPVQLDLFEPQAQVVGVSAAPGKGQ
jgi:hypothetical protein